MGWLYKQMQKSHHSEELFEQRLEEKGTTAEASIGFLRVFLIAAAMIGVLWALDNPLDNEPPQERVHIIDLIKEKINEKPQ